MYQLETSKYLEDRSVCLIDKCVRSIGLPEPMLFFYQYLQYVRKLSVNLANNKKRKHDEYLCYISIFKRTIRKQQS